MMGKLSVRPISIIRDIPRRKSPPLRLPSIICSRFLVCQAQKGPWSSLSPSEQAAWKALHFTEESWEGRRSPPSWKHWSELSNDELAAAMHGLGVKDAAAWNALAPPSKTAVDQRFSSAASKTDIPSLSSLLDGTYDSGGDDDNDSNKTSSALVVAQETRAIRQQQQASSAGGTFAKMALNTVKGLAPVLGPMMRDAARHSSRGNQGMAMAIAGTLLERVPSVMDAHSGVLEVTGIDTVVYLDDSISMQEGSNLHEGRKALESLEARLKTNQYDDDSDQRFLPTRIVKFGDHPLVLSPSEEDWSVSLVCAAWDGSSGGTYMWKMIQDDIKSKYRPAGGKLRVVVITDGADTLSPGPYRGVRGFDPLMKHLLGEGFDIEWHIIVVGNHGWMGWSKELSERDEVLYESLCRATGGQFISIGAEGWDEHNDDAVADFLESVELSGYDDSEKHRKERQEQYKLEARKGKAEHFDWLPALPDKDNN